MLAIKLKKIRLFIIYILDCVYRCDFVAYLRECVTTETLARYAWILYEATTRHVVHFHPTKLVRTYHQIVFNVAVLRLLSSIYVLFTDVKKKLAMGAYFWFFCKDFQILAIVSTWVVIFHIGWRYHINGHNSLYISNIMYSVTIVYSEMIAKALASC